MCANLMQHSWPQTADSKKKNIEIKYTKNKIGVSGKLFPEDVFPKQYKLCLESNQLEPIFITHLSH